MRGREFTGRHMAYLIIAFFGVVIAVNLLMATLATRTFGGTVVDNSYVASQRFNSWLREAREQAELGWIAETGSDSSGRLVAAVRGPGGPLSGAVVEAYASHPLGREPARRLALSPVGDGTYRSHAPLAGGRWIVRLSVRRDGHEARFLTQVGR